MYEIRPESLKSFIEDTNIKLPRFQRKQTWDDKKNFELVISIFKEYPMGVSILNVEDNDGLKTRWLLDGRQRRNALRRFYEDPENVYLWAKKYLGLKGNDQLQDLEEKFWTSINEYLEHDEVEELDSSDSESEEEDIEITEVNEEKLVYDTSKQGLELLLHIIKMTHYKNKTYSGFTRPFDFSKEIPRLPYLSIDEKGKQFFNSRKLKSFINEYKRFCNDESIDTDKSDRFMQFFAQRFSYDKATEKKVEIKIDRNWDNILERMDVLDKITNIGMRVLPLKTTLNKQVVWAALVLI